MNSGTEPNPPGLGDRARDDIRFIRDAMERASVFTAVPGWGNVAIGVVALAVASFAAGVGDDTAWVLLWTATAVFCFVLAVVLMSRKAARAGSALVGASAARFWAGLVPTFASGALLTVPLLRAGQADLLPTLWMLLYGAAVTTAGAHSVRLVPLMGVSFMVAGALSFFVGDRNAAMAVGFGGLHVVFGFIIARNHGG